MKEHEGFFDMQDQNFEEYEATLVNPEREYEIFRKTPTTSRRTIQGLHLRQLSICTWEDVPTAFSHSYE